MPSDRRIVGRDSPKQIWNTGKCPNILSKLNTDSEIEVLNVQGFNKII